MGGLYSFLPHKELRFIFPALSILNVAAAAGAARCLRMKGFLNVVAVLGLVGLAVATLAGCVVMTAASASNYPGGVALRNLHAAEAASPPLSVHIGILAAISGNSRFLEGHKTWSYSKEEGLKADDLFNRGFDRIVEEWPSVPGYACQSVVEGFERIALRRPPLFPIEIVRRPQVYTFVRTSNGSPIPCGDTSQGAR